MNKNAEQVTGPVVLRVTRHPLSERAKAVLRRTYPRARTVDVRVLPFDGDPVGAVLKAISCVPGRVVAVELQARREVVRQVAPALRNLGIDLIRMEPRRVASMGGLSGRGRRRGKVVVVGQDEQGRDILEFDCYLIHNDPPGFPSRL